jgi:hypothetical protein
VRDELLRQLDLRMQLAHDLCDVRRMLFEGAAAWKWSSGQIIGKK